MCLEKFYHPITLSPFSITPVKDYKSGGKVCLGIIWKRKVGSWGHVPCCKCKRRAIRAWNATVLVPHALLYMGVCCLPFASQNLDSLRLQNHFNGQNPVPKIPISSWRCRRVEPWVQGTATFSSQRERLANSSYLSLPRLLVPTQGDSGNHQFPTPLSSKRHWSHPGHHAQSRHNLVKSHGFCNPQP